MTPLDVALVAASGVVAGGINAVAGGGTLVAFPALLATGMSARTANIVSTIGLVPGYAGGSLAYRNELRGQGARVRALLVVSAVGGVAGAVVLVTTPAHSFRTVVPFLIMASCVLLAMQTRIGAVVARRRSTARGREITAVVQTGVLISGVYGAYFGAGLGVLLLALLGVLVSDDLQRLNALKGLLSFLINAVSVVVFVVAGHVAWWYTGILAATAWVGGNTGVRLARRLSPILLRWAVIVFGFAVAIALLVR